jgi:cytochrome oxidase assembly protein ShyY1
MLKLALSVKWLGALLLCFLLAGIFAALAQWQVTRSVLPNSDNASWDIVQTQPIEEIAQPGESYTFSEISKSGKKKVLTEITTNVVFYPSSAVLVANRIQLDGKKGFWLVIPAHNSSGKLYVAVGFAKDEATANTVLAKVRKPSDVVMSHSAMSTFTPVQGRYIPSEAPEQQIANGTLSSLSVAQLINLTDEAQSTKSNTFTGALVLTQANQFSSRLNLETITIGLAKSETQLNWLSAFYAIEWTVFALFALFIWWRLLSDAYLKQQSKIGE